MSYHHNSIRKYVAALLSTFNGIEIQYTKSTSEVVSKNIPITYTTKEKCRILDSVTSEQLLSGNYNVLPRSSLALLGMNKSSERTTNKNVKINQYKTEDSIDYLYNSVAYEFSFELSYQCRGMNEATQIVEQIVPKFNPTINVDIWDATNLDEPTRVPIRLDGVEIESEEYDELSSNIFTVVFNLTLQGNLYPPIKSIERIKEVKMLLNEYDDNNLYTRKSILGWDVDADGNLENGETIVLQDTSTYIPTISSINEDSSVVGDNDLTVIYEDKDNIITELTLQWVVISGDASITFDKENAVLTANSTGSVEVQVTITDPYDNFASLNKVLTIV